MGGRLLQNENPLDSQYLAAMDLDDYLKTGRKQSTRNDKIRMVQAGESPILTSQNEAKKFIDDAILKDENHTIKAFSKVDERFAKDVYAASNGHVDIRGKYLELSADDIRHSYTGHAAPKQAGDIPISVSEYEKIPQYMRNYDDIVYAVTEKNGRTTIQLGKK